MTTKSIEVTDLLQLHVRGEDMYVGVRTADGDQLSIMIPKGLDREIVHIMVDALLLRESKDFHATAGHVLAPGELQPLEIEKKIEKLQLQEKFVLQAKSPGATSLTLRLAPSSVQKWIEDAEVQLARRLKPKLQS
jgi:hypothetical protein